MGTKAQYVKRFIRKENKNTFLTIVKERLIDGFGVAVDEEGDLSTAELAISGNEICIATMLEDEPELDVYFVDGRTKTEKIKVLFSTDYLADEMLGCRF